MKYNPNIHHRRSIRLKGYDYSQSGLYFVTICVQNHQCLFGKITDGEITLNDAGQIIENEWKNLKIKYPHVTLHEYAIMPNHFHGIVEITNTANVGAGFARPDNAGFTHPDNNVNDDMGQANPAPTLGNVIGYFKFQTTKKMDLPVKLWQRNYWEHIIRNDESYQRIANYIINNPVNWETDKFYFQG